jgi:sentrin-specific protease 1
MQCPGSPRHDPNLACQHRYCAHVVVEFGRGVTQRDKIPVSRLSIRCLRLGEWLNDEVVNYVLALYQARNDAATAGDRLLRCYFFGTMFYPTLLAHGYTRVRRHTAAKHGIDIFAQELLFVPIHCFKNHWALAVVNWVDKRFEYFDSCGYSDNGVLSNLRSYVADEMKDKQGGAIWDDSGWTDHVWKDKDGTPKQKNGWDCGLFMLKTADLLAQNARVVVEQVLPP